MKVKSGKLKYEAAVKLVLKCLELLTEKAKVKIKKSESVEDRAVAKILILHRPNPRAPNTDILKIQK